MPDTASIPDNALIILPIRGMVLFPGAILPLTIARERSVAAAQEAARSGRPIGVLLQRSPDVDVPTANDLYRVGTVASIARYVTTPDGHHLICQGEQRFRIVEFLSGHPYFVASVERMPEEQALTPEIEARMHVLRQQASESLKLLPQVPTELTAAVEAMDSPSARAALAASLMDTSPAEKQDILETFDLKERLDKVLKLLAQRLEVLRLTQEINQQTKATMDERQREFV